MGGNVQLFFFYYENSVQTFYTLISKINMSVYCDIIYNNLRFYHYIDQVLQLGKIYCLLVINGIHDFIILILQKPVIS